MIIREIQAHTLLSSAKKPDDVFGIKYTMNLYRGCQHRCIYCDSRSACYPIENFGGEILVKANANDQSARQIEPGASPVFERIEPWQRWRKTAL